MRRVAPYLAGVLLWGSFFPGEGRAATGSGKGKLGGKPAEIRSVLPPGVPHILPAAPGFSHKARFIPAAAGLEKNIAELSPENTARQPDEEVSRRSARLIDGAGAASGAAVDGTGAGLSPAAGLGAWAAEEPSSAPRSRTSVPRPRSGLRLGLGDRYHYARLNFHNFWWYTVTHIVDLWNGPPSPTGRLSYQPQVEALVSAGVVPAVSKTREFFTYMRIVGTGEFYVLGFAPLKDELLVAEAKKAFADYFDAPGAGRAQRAAFNAFVKRARNYNAENRSRSNLRKVIRDAMLDASVKPAAELVPYFNGLIPEGLQSKTAEFQKKKQRKVLESFRQVLLEGLREEPAGGPGRVVAAVILGSFAKGGASAGSDFDVEIVTEDGRGERVAAFIKRVKDKWIASGGHAKNPVTFHEFPQVPSKGVLLRVHSGRYIVVSPSDELAGALQRKPDEDGLFKVNQELNAEGRFYRKLHYAIVYAVTCWTDLAPRLKKAAVPALLLAFGGFNGYVAWQAGYWSVFPPFQHLPMTQMFMDLSISLGLIMSWMLMDWKKQNRPLHRLFPYLIATVLFGSMGPLLYLLLGRRAPGPKR